MKISRILPILIAILSLVLLSSKIVFADVDTPVDQSENSAGPVAPTTGAPIAEPLPAINAQSPYMIEIVVGTQSPWDKSVPITVKIKPSADTTRTNITWDTPIGLTLSDKNAQKYLPVPAGQVYSASVRVKPEVSGTYTIAATATDWGYGANFASTDSVSITFDENLTVTPADPAYASAVVIRFVVLGLVAVIGIAIFVIIIKILLKKLKEYLKPPEL